MNLKGFTSDDFNVFHIDGLEARMEAIKGRIQPKFREMGQPLCSDLAASLGNDMYLHIAKHARRTVNAPKDTWLSISSDKRGYKKHPHFQFGLFDDHIFIWLAFIYELPNKEDIAQSFLNHFDQIMNTIPSDFVISLDHMKKDAFHIKDLGEKGLRDALTRFKNVKKAEFLVGRHIVASDPILMDGPRLFNLIRETFFSLIPIYHLAFNMNK